MAAQSRFWRSSRKSHNAPEIEYTPKMMISKYDIQYIYSYKKKIYFLCISFVFQYKLPE